VEIEVVRVGKRRRRRRVENMFWKN